MNNNMNELYKIDELLYIWYNAKTELYDRTLTKEKSPFDSTSAYPTGETLKLSTSYALKLWKFIMWYCPMYKRPKGFISHYNSQSIIDFYNFLNKNNDLMKRINKDYLFYLDKISKV